MFNVKMFKLLLLAFFVVLAIWLFFWPCVEMFYEMSLSPLLDGSLHKQIGFAVGFVAFVSGVVTGSKFIV